ncbi:MAG: saccharopine dehydrogenase NADP-binding domain-containing protein [Planctomycetes bacterium]|nr:saccharopine dehydrogenase NADP-binding domain-containing protein [Planctomycetota bacterium]MCB9888511.1 saccharopine dehydrogenase NADP-binding domain-containing protein [Planctomycetota bacterium]
MRDVVLIGAGKIGRMVAHFLGFSGDYALRVVDGDQAAVDRICTRVPGARGHAADFTDPAALDEVMRGAAAVVSCAPFHCNPVIAERARANRLHYFDLTEDVRVTDQVEALAKGAETAFVPQCGLAPGFITIVAMHLLQPMTDVTDLRLRVGALPRFPGNRLKYNLTWSTEGLINEYCQPCEVLLDGRLATVQPLENLEEIMLDGVRYEAFNTSGGLGTLAETLKGKVRNVSYKSIRYPGHNYLLKFLLDDMRLKDDQQALAAMWERTLPTTFRDQIVIFVTAVGMHQGKLTENVFARTIYHREIDGENWSGIQITTAAGVCAVVDMLFDGALPQQGFVRMEDVSYATFIQNRFGAYYA